MNLKHNNCLPYSNSLWLLLHLPGNDSPFLPPLGWYTSSSWFWMTLMLYRLTRQTIHSKHRQPRKLMLFLSLVFFRSFRSSQNHALMRCFNVVCMVSLPPPDTHGASLQQFISLPSPWQLCGTEQILDLVEIPCPQVFEQALQPLQADQDTVKRIKITSSQMDKNFFLPSLAAYSSTALATIWSSKKAGKPPL